MKTVHHFWQQKVREELCAVVREVFYESRHMVERIQPVSVAFEKLAGIDKVMSLHNGARNTYEDKTDFRAADTTNLFLEIWSKKPEPNRPGVRGWGYTCGAQYIDFFLPQHRTILLGETLRLKTLIRRWDEGRAYRTGEAVNEGYLTVGLLVPVATVAKEGALMVLEVPEDVIRGGVARYIKREAEKVLGRLLDAESVSVIADLSLKAHEIIGAPCGRLRGVMYRTAGELAGILANMTQLDIVRERLQQHGEISEEWFARFDVGARLAPLVEKLRDEGWRIRTDKSTRTYHLTNAAEPVTESLSLFDQARTA